MAEPSHQGTELSDVEVPGMKRWWTALAVILLGMPLLQPVPSRAREARAEEARGTMTFAASESRSVLIHVPRTAVIPDTERHRRLQGPNRWVRIEGGGRFVGVVMVREPHVPGARPQWPIVIGQFRECDRPGCYGRRVHNYLGPDFDNEEDGIKIPTGDYRIHLVTDGDPARVTISFQGLDGEALITPRDSSPLDLKTPEQSLVGDGNHLWSAGASYQAGSVGFSLSATWVKLGSTSQGFNMGTCQIQWPTAPPEAAYGPHCNYLGAGTLWGSLEPIDDDEFVLINYFGYHDQGAGPESIDGRFGLGTWFESRGVPIERVGNTTFFLQTAETWD